jgi:L-alanine-DL-glutamate epimerase-like enolase superfamily enzyme
MQIESLETRISELAFPRPIGTALHQMYKVGCVLVTIRASEGLTGEGFPFPLNGDRIQAFEETIHGLSPNVVGNSAHDVERIFSEIWTALNPTGHAGITISALSTIDVALWDTVGKSVNMPMAHRLGSNRCSTSPSNSRAVNW